MMSAKKLKTKYSFFLFLMKHFSNNNTPLNDFLNKVASYLICIHHTLFGRTFSSRGVCNMPLCSCECNTGSVRGRRYPRNNLLHTEQKSILALLFNRFLLIPKNKVCSNKLLVIVAGGLS